MLNKIQLIFFVLSFLIIPVKELYATDLFFDDFNYQDLSKWNSVENGGTIKYENGILKLSSNVINFPYIFNSAGSVLVGVDGFFEFKFNYSKVDYMGNGLSIGFTNTDGGPNYQFSIWNDLSVGPMFQYQNFNMLQNGECDKNSNIGGLQKISLEGKLSLNDWHIFKIIKTGNKYQVQLDSETIYTSLSDQCLPENIFIGNPYSGGRTWWSELNVDYFKIYNISPKNKIIIIPGLGASWNAEAILLGNTTPSFQWTMTPFVKNYNLLIEALEKNGLTRNKDFYVWNYDWRKPLNQIVSDFNNYFSVLNLESGQKVDLVGHSLGGLVARLWTQDHQGVVNQTITLGSPHFGSVKAYEAWNGVKISDSVDVASVALNVLLQLQKKNNDSLVQTLRNYAPIVFDLSPTFNFLKKNGNQIEVEKSQYLVDKNNVLAQSFDKLYTIDGIGVKTKEWINLSERSVFDKVLGIWKDGRPLSYVYGEGDGTVLKKSAQILGTQTTEYDSNHGELVDKSTNLVLSKLGLGVTVIITVDYPQKEAVFYLGSPANMTVKCGEVEKSDIDGWVIFENQDAKNCQVKLTGKDQGGTFHLVIGDDNNWQYFEGNIKKDQIIKFLENQTKDSWQILRDDFEKIGAKLALKSAKKENIMETVDAYMLFRLTKENFKYSEEILDNLKIILSKRKVGVMENNMTYYLAEWKKDLVEKRIEFLKKKNINPSYAASFNYKQANDLLKPGLYYAQNLLAQRLFLIVWK